MEKNGALLHFRNLETPHIAGAKGQGGSTTVLKLFIVMVKHRTAFFLIPRRSVPRMSNKEALGSKRCILSCTFNNTGHFSPRVGHHSKPF